MGNTSFRCSKNKVTPEPIAAPRARASRKRKSSIAEDFEDIVNAFAGANAWSKKTITSFFFSSSSLVTGSLLTLASQSKRYDSWSFLLVILFNSCVFSPFSVCVNYVSTRALVIVASNRGTYLKSKKSEFRFVGGRPTISNKTDVEMIEEAAANNNNNTNPLPPSATVNFDKTYGPFQTVNKVAFFIIFLFLIGLPGIYE